MKKKKITKKTEDAVAEPEIIEVKNQLLGQITGLLTNSEYQFYYSKKKEMDTFT